MVNVTWQPAMMIEVGVGDLVRRIGDDQVQVGTQWSDDREVE
jgi:hypothetical protein